MKTYTGKYIENYDVAESIDDTDHLILSNSNGVKLTTYQLMKEGMLDAVDTHLAEDLSQIQVNKIAIEKNEKGISGLDDRVTNLEEVVGNKIYGVKRTLSSTSTAWERTDDAIGLIANATHDGSTVVNDFDDIYPYSDIITVNYDTSLDRVVARYGDANFAFDGSNGEVMTYIPQFYIKRENDGNTESIQISKAEFDGATLIEPFYVARYTIASDGAHSKSGVASKVRQTVTQFRTLANAIGSKWGQLDWHFFVIEYLYLVEYANANSQSILGQGACSTSAQVANGACDSLGMKSGCLANDGKSSVIYRGIENIFGNLWQFMDGCNAINNELWMCFDKTKYAVDTTDNYTDIAKLATSNGYPTTMCYNKSNQLVGMPSTVGTSCYGDYYWQAAGNRIAFVGGHWHHGSNVGLFSFNVDNDSSLSGSSVSARLIKIL